MLDASSSPSATTKREKLEATAVQRAAIEAVRTRAQAFGIELIITPF
jgi:hypothetical protein